jgi:hypothetical protein
MTKQFVKTQWNNDREPAITAEQLNRIEKGIDVNDTRIVELDKAVTANKTAGDKSLAEVNKTLQKHTEDITAVNNELTSQSKAIGELSDKKITKFYASSQGEITLNDSDNGKMQDMMLYGKSEQKQYSGKNLLNFAGAKGGTNNGITVTVLDDNSYSYVGTATGSSINVWLFGAYNTATSVLHLDKGIYYAKGVNLYIVSSGSSGWVNGRDGGFYTVPDGGIDFCGIRAVAAVAGMTYNEIIYPYIVKVDNTDTIPDWEPYVGGIPSPNPDYPQEIKSVVNPTVKVTGKNLLNPTLQTKTVNGVTCTNNGDGTYTLNGTATNNTTFYVRGNIPADGKTYRIVGCPKAMSLNTAYVDFSNNINNARKDTGNGTTISLTGGYKYTVAIVAINGYTCKNLVFKPMIVDADKYPSVTYDDFEPYREQSVTLTGITLNAIPVSSGGNVTIDGQQYISDYVDVERGKIIRKVRKMILKGSENWSVEADGKIESHRMFTDVSKNYAAIVHLSSSIIGALCSHFIETSADATWNATQKNAFSFGANGIRLHVRKKGVLTVDEWKSWLNDNNITVYYPLATPIEESISEELAEKLKALQTYYSQTNLFITSNQLDGYAIFNYPISLANGWNYVKQQIGDTRDYIYDMDLQSSQAYVNSEYAVVLTELEV